jgi:hypothetical protein
MKMECNYREKVILCQEFFDFYLFYLFICTFTYLIYKIKYEIHQL